jgi:ABC-2 type transport system ATP-binding protein
MLDVRGLTKKYRNLAVVDHVTFTVPPGQVTGYLGPNGSGKSTTVKMLAGLLPATSGQILWNGADIRLDLVAFKRRLGYVPEEAFVYPHLSGLEYLQLIGRLRQLPERLVDRKANELLRLLWLEEHRYSPISAYSKGMKQRVLLAGALLHDPDLLILDEPLSGLDITSAMLLHELIAELARHGKTILYISHVLEVTEKVCSRVVMLYRGRIVANDDVSRLRELMNLPSLEEIFRQLARQEDVGASARQIAAVMREA